jgi:hypothetical protein
MGDDLRKFVELAIAILKWIEKQLQHEHHKQYAIRITYMECDMPGIVKKAAKANAIGSISSPGNFALQLALLVSTDGGNTWTPYVPPAGSTYVFSPSLELNPADASISLSDDPTVVDQVDGVCAAGDTNASATFNASATAPDGSTANGTLTIPIVAVEPLQQFSIGITQTA